MFKNCQGLPPLITQFPSLVESKQMLVIWHDKLTVVEPTLGVLSLGGENDENNILFFVVKHKFY